MKYQLFFTCMFTMSVCYSGSPADHCSKVPEVLRDFPETEERKIEVVITGSSPLLKQDVSDHFSFLFANLEGSTGHVYRVAKNDEVKKFNDDKMHGMSLKGLKNPSRNMFNGLRNITDLNLSGNRLKYLPPGIFSDVPLQCLSLSDNLFTTVPSLALEGLNCLTRLDLSDNQIEYLLLQGFADLSSLRILRLAKNRLKKIPPEALTGLGVLVSLNLSGNQLSKVDKSDFSQLRALQYLFLDDNRIEDASLETCKWLKTLRNFKGISSLF